MHQHGLVECDNALYSAAGVCLGESTGRGHFLHKIVEEREENEQHQQNQRDATLTLCTRHVTRADTVADTG